jgi:hypothetical protein
MNQDKLIKRIIKHSTPAMKRHIADLMKESQKSMQGEKDAHRQIQTKKRLVQR